MARKERKYHFIYKTTNLLTGRYYFGMHSTSNLDDDYLGSGKRLRYSIRKYGEENHKREIIEFCKNKKELKKREKEIVNLNEVAKKDCMNLIVGGEGGWSFANKAFKEKLKNDLDFQKKISKQNSKSMKQVYKKGIREKLQWGNWNGRKHTEETKAKIKKAVAGKHIGSKNSQFGTCWITKDMINKKIKKEELENYLNDGWMKGRIF